MIKLLYTPPYQSIKEITDEVKILIDANHIVNLIDALDCCISLQNKGNQIHQEDNKDLMNDIIEDLKVNIQPLKKLI